MFSRFFRREPEPESQPAAAESAETPPQPGVRLVQCVKLGRELPGLARPPFPGELGQRIYEHISAAAWDMWKQQSVLLINHYGLVLADPEARKFLNKQMEEFLFEDQAQMPEGWTPEGQGVGAKGAPAPRKK
jgi:Fe-S cluster biosynthesis and repair protein YggX